MANFFQERLVDFGFNPTNDDQYTGVREFIETPGGSFEEGVSLPVLGDAFPTQPNFTNPTNFIARRIRIKNYSNVTGQERFYRVEYATKDASSSSGNPDPETEPESLTLGSEITRVENQGSNNSSTTAGGVAIQGAINLFTLMHTYQKTTVQDTFAEAITAAQTSKFQKILTGNPNWLYSGADIDMYITNGGDEKARSVRTYTYKEVAGNIVGATAEESWNLVWNVNQSAYLLINPLLFAETGAFPDAMPWDPVP